MASNSPLRVAAWQCEARSLDIEGSLARLKSAAQAASTNGADVIVTPEMFLTGYNITAADARRLAEPADGPIAYRIMRLSEQTGVAIAYGYPELGQSGEIYNSVQIIDGADRVGSHRKMHLFEDLDLKRFTPAETPPSVATLRGHKVGLLICYDVEFPESVRALALHGAEAVLVPTANMVGYEIVSTVLVRARARESSCFLVYANYCGREGTLCYAGLSTICAPDGGVLASATSSESLVIADLQADWANVAGYLNDRRSDLFG